MKKYESGRFYAKRFYEKVYEFIVYIDNTMECPALGLEVIHRIVLSPRFDLVGKDFTFVNPAPLGVIDGLIKEYIIDDDLFEFLEERNMIMYSTDMAYLYDFQNKKVYDSCNGKEKRPFKKAMKKGPILVKWKNGQYN